MATHTDARRAPGALAVALTALYVLAVNAAVVVFGVAVYSVFLRWVAPWLGAPEHFPWPW